MDAKRYPGIGETLYQETLLNGLTVYVIPKPDYRRSFAVLAAHYGGAMRRFSLDGAVRDTPAGVAHFLEHKMFDMPDGGSALGVLSASGASPNAFTGQDMTAYYFSCTDRLLENLEYLLTFVSTPYYTDGSVAKEQGIIGQEISMTEDDPSFRVYVELMRCLYGESPLGNSVAGTAESIAEITAQTLYDCHRAFYRPSNMALCVMGSVDPEEVAAAARRVLGGQAGEAPEPDYGPAPSREPVRAESRLTMEVSAPQFLFGAKAAPAARGDGVLRQSLTASLALTCLMGRSSRFYTELYAQGLLTADFAYEFSYAGGSAAIVAGGESPDPDAVRARLDREVARVGREGLDPELFERSSRAMYGARLRALDSFDEQSVAMVNGCFYGFNDLDALALLPELTAGECRSFITENLAPAHIALSVAAPVK